MTKAVNSRSATAETGHHRDLSWPEPPEALPGAVIDNHAHLDFSDGEGSHGIEEHVAWADRVGVRGIITIGCDLPSARWTAEVMRGEHVAEEHRAFVRERLRGGCSIHPNDAVNHVVTGTGRSGEELCSLDEAIAEISELLDTPGMVTVGETGLDWFRTSKKKPEKRNAQIQSFRMHIALAKEKGLPMQIHDRDAHRDVLDVLDAEGAPERTVFHCFSGDAEFAREALERGAYLSFSGTSTFKNAAYLREALAVTPLNRIMVETDAPFLTPEPYRGRPNSSYLIPHTMRVIAEAKGVSLEEACAGVLATERDVYGFAGAEG
ncbi:TatD family hydrolase [Dermabacter vaginalis]|uniref:TatD family hydrolase n=1 Tax=Dermabacter vaginalis TaxID=1630135 RepID=A0A1B0ZHQ5_9MICO|nr:TatD family hydrolase [Dermabacter vaginalis]ANP27447.1 TatD family hydrolase [Dermabacter vaginalis]